MQAHRHLNDFKVGTAASSTPKLRKWIWFGLFSVWILFLSGLIGEWTGGTPGLIQFGRLKGMLSDRQNKIALLRSRIGQLEAEKQKLEGNRAFQLEEIRRVLGYVGSDELVFDFGH